MLTTSSITKIITPIFFALLLVSCGGSGSSKSTQITLKKFSHVKIHYKLLHDQGMIWGEVGSKPPYNSITLNLPIIKASPKGSKTLHVSSTAKLIKNQLITYLGNDGIYYVGQVKKISSPEDISLIEPLKAAVKVGNNAWDFYGNSSHANQFGFRAIADFSIKSLGFGSKTTGIPLLLGDSWFDEGSFYNRLVKKLPNATIINKGVGGHTTRDLVNRFDNDVTPNAPNYVWIISGTNDYWKGISTAEFKTNLNTLINKSKAIGAKVIIIDSSVGEGTNKTTHIPNKKQSDEYADIVPKLY